MLVSQIFYFDKVHFWTNSLLQKLVCQTLSLIFVFFMKNVTFSYFLVFANIFLEVATLHGAFLQKECGIQVLAGLAQSVQTVGSFLRAPRPAKPAL
jgi:hypothetical protein